MGTVDSVAGGLSKAAELLGQGWLAIVLVATGFAAGILLTLSIQWNGILSGSELKLWSFAHRRLPRWMRFRPNLGRVHYLASRNSVVRDSIADTSEFLDVFFGAVAGGPLKESDVGQIWLFHSDLAAFRSELYFRRLYEERALKWRSVEKIRVVVSPRMVYRDGMTEVETRKVLRDWQFVLANLQSCPSADKIEACGESDAVSFVDLPDDFWSFVSEEAWVFYVRGAPLQADSRICIHRRFLHRGELGQQSDRSDERITITASFGGGTRLRDGDPLKSFVKQRYLDQFEGLFTSQQVPWIKLTDFAERAVQELEAKIASSAP